jgi:NADH-quinone oxidoreductase subunit L
MKLILLFILLFPLAGFLSLGIGFRRIPRKIASILGPGTIVISFLFSLWLFISHHSGSITQNYFTWISAGDLVIPFSLLVDPLSVLMLLVVTGVGSIIHIYSAGYMKEDPGFNRFFSYMNLFVFSMLLLVLGSNYPIMFIGWEGVGLCSYLLIGFWFKNDSFNYAARKAFIMNRIGDLGFLLGMFLLFRTFGSLDYTGVFGMAKLMTPGDPVIMAITLLLFVGAVGKSAQIPLYTWLPDAMAGPTPVSALIHAATMVTAGVYMVARSGILYALSPVTLIVIAVTGTLTALFAASIAIFQDDIKKVLAYSTISQLGYMFLGLGVGAFTGAIFHLTTHAFFKALLFLGAGSVIHALSGEQDIRKMGGLKAALPKTHFTFLVATLAIAGLPPLAGFFSKDEILAGAFSHNLILWVAGVAGSLLTAFYMFRLYDLTFRGEFRGSKEQEHHLHESPNIMIIPLAFLAFLSVFGGFINIPHFLGGRTWLETWLDPVFADARSVMGNSPHLQPSTEWIITLVTLAGILISIYLAYIIYIKQNKGIVADGSRRNPLSNLLYHKYYIDELYDKIIVKPVMTSSKLLYEYVEKRFLDRIVNGVGKLAVWTGNTVRYVQTGNVGFYLFMMIFGILLILLFNVLI